MAVLTHESGESITDSANTNELLSGIGVEFSTWPIPEDAALQGLLAADQLSDEQNERVLACFEDRFQYFSARRGIRAET